MKRWVLFVLFLVPIAEASPFPTATIPKLTGVTTLSEFNATNELIRESRKAEHVRGLREKAQAPSLNDIIKINRLFARQQLVQGTSRSSKNAPRHDS